MLPLSSLPRATAARTAARDGGAVAQAPATVVIDDDGLGLDDLIRQIERRR